MKKLITVLVCLLFAMSVIAAAGCAKKEEPAKPAEPEKKAEEAKPGEAKPAEAAPAEKAPEKK
ncbi:MAG TPA: hypothetical protein VEH09_12320 [Thermodesulfobacteriota bacterium]|nr:hypothetical protein [Thermodesulfobacteriota bacterium]